MTTTGEEWAIQADNGLYWNGIKSGWEETLRDSGRHSRYCDAASQVVRIDIDGARIVPAPPREMTDDEAEAWYQKRDLSSYIKPTKADGGGFHCYANVANGEACGAWASGYGSSIYDAIRAARRALEKKP